MRFAWTGDYDHPSTFTGILHSESPRFDELIDDYPLAPLYFYVSKHLVSTSVRGLHPNVLDQHPSRFMHLTK